MDRHEAFRGHTGWSLYNVSIQDCIQDRNEVAPFKQRNVFLTIHRFLTTESSVG